MDDSLARRKADLEQKLAQARAEHFALQEEALLCVPQELLNQVNGGTTADFARICEQMEAANARELDSFVKLLDRS